MNSKAQALLTPAFILLAAYASALPLPNDSDASNYFPGTTLNDKDILEKVERFKKIKYPDVKSAEALTEIGMPALPYAIQLAGIRRSRFLFSIYAKYIRPQFIVERPYGTHAGLIVEGMRDPRARPFLLKLIDHPQLGPHAKNALVRMPEAVDYETVLHMLEKDDAGLNSVYRYKGVYSPLIARLTPQERIRILSSLLDSHAFKFCLDMRGHGSGPGNDALHENLNNLIEDLGETRSPLVLQLLQNTLSNLQEPRDAYEKLQGDPYFSNIRKEEFARVARIRKTLQRAIANVSQN